METQMQTAQPFLELQRAARSQYSSVTASGMPEATLTRCPHKTRTLRKLTHKVIEGEAGLIKFPSAGCLIAILPWVQAHLHSWFVAFIWILQWLHINQYPSPSLDFYFDNPLNTTWNPKRPGAANMRRFTFPLSTGREEYKKWRTENEQTAKFQKCLISTQE